MAQVTFPAEIGGNGSTFSDDANETTGMANGGHKVRLIPMLAQIVAVGVWVKAYVDAQVAAITASLNAASGHASDADASADIAVGSASTATSAATTAVDAAADALAYRDQAQEIAGADVIEINNRLEALETAPNGSFTRVTADHLASPGELVLVDNTVGQVTVSLPVAPADGETVTIALANTAKQKPAKINRNGKTIHGRTRNVFLATRGIPQRLIYNSADGDWSLI